MTDLFNNGTIFKTCKTCKQAKPLCDFHKKVDTLHGVNNHCKVCRSFKHKGKTTQATWQKERETVKGRAKHLFRDARSRARIFKLDFNITQEYIETIIYLGKCQRSGIPFDLSKPVRTRYNHFSPSVDKIDPFGGYTFDNVVIVVNCYNFGKMQMSEEQFIWFCKQVAEFNK